MTLNKVHIIKPSLVKLNTIIEAIKSNRFHYSWLLVLISRAFLHESKYIVRWAVNTFLQSDIHLKIKNLKSENIPNFLRVFNSFLFKPFILILQKSYVFKR